MDCIVGGDTGTVRLECFMGMYYTKGCIRSLCEMDSDITLYSYGRWSRREADDFPPLCVRVSSYMYMNNGYIYYMVGG
jgi:hypothetical protein